MSDLKERRQRAIVDLIRGSALANQDELAERLSGLGFAVTQATISRDLEQLGAVKVRRNGELTYALPDQVRGAPNPRLAAVFRDWMRSIDVAVNLVVIRTPPVSSHRVGVALVQSVRLCFGGMICCDDTIFVARPWMSEPQAIVE